MIDLEKIEKQIISFGLSSREAKVYTTLFRKKDFTALEIQQLANIPRTKIYEVLRKLINKEMCLEKKTAHHRKYEAVNPDLVFKKLQKGLEEKITLANEISKTLAIKYEQIEDKGNPLEYVEVIQTPARIKEKYTMLSRNAKEEILAFTKGPYAEEWDVATELTYDSAQKGLVQKSIYEVSDILENDFLKWIEMCAEAGEEVRISYELPFKMLIFDEDAVLVALRDKISYKPNLTTSMIIRHQDMAKAFKIIFYSIWNSAMTIDEYKKKGS